MLILQFIEKRIFWEPLKLISYGIYSMIIIFSIFKPFASTLLLFFLIALWSRIPTLVSDLIKDLDMIDFFVVILSINISGVFGGFFAVVVMFFSRLFGPSEEMEYTIIESAALFCSAILTPIFFSVLGNILLTMYAFTIIRNITYYSITYLISFEYFLTEIPYILIGLPAAYMSNTAMMKFLGPFFSSAINNGLNFNIPLFMLASLFIMAIYAFPKRINILNFLKGIGKNSCQVTSYDEFIKPPLSLIKRKPMKARV